MAGKVGRMVHVDSPDDALRPDPGLGQLQIVGERRVVHKQSTRSQVRVEQAASVEGKEQVDGVYADKCYSRQRMTEKWRQVIREDVVRG